MSYTIDYPGFDTLNSPLLRLGYVYSPLRQPTGFDTLSK